MGVSRSKVCTRACVCECDCRMLKSIYMWETIEESSSIIEPAHEKRVLSSSDAEIEISIALER